MGQYLDLLDQQYLDFLLAAHNDLVAALKQEEKDIPENRGVGPYDFDFKQRELDCAVIRWAHEIAKKKE